MTKTVFVDCGSNLGQGYEGISNTLKFDENTTIHMFEPNKICFKKLQEKYPNFNLHNEAVWCKNEQRILTLDYCKYAKDYVGGNTNIMQDEYIKPTNSCFSDKNKDDEELTTCIDFSEFVTLNLNKDDFNVLKLDIEGAEHEVLKKLFETNTIVYFKQVFIEWHTTKSITANEGMTLYSGKFKDLDIIYQEWH